MFDAVAFHPLKSLLESSYLPLGEKALQLALFLCGLIITSGLRRMTAWEAGAKIELELPGFTAAGIHRQE